MEHKLRLTVQEKIKACLDLSDFTFKMMKNILNKHEFNKRLNNLRKRHLREDLDLLEKLGKVKK